jgi:hypothetical protein
MKTYNDIKSFNFDGGDKQAVNNLNLTEFVKYCTASDLNRIEKFFK